jgi:hypothetical protein
MLKIRSSWKIGAAILSLGLFCATPAWAMDSLGSPADLGGAGVGMPNRAGHSMPHFHPYRTVHLTGMHSAVIEAMAYECPFCRALNSEILRWAQTLPARFISSKCPQQ